MKKHHFKRRPFVCNNTGKVEWYTPAYIIEAARETMGSIDLDPASSDIANRTVKANTYYTKEDDGLSKLWFGNVWLNPPYAKLLIKQFIMAAIEKRSEYKQAIILVNNATETRWFQDLLNIVSVVCFHKHRIKFNDVDGESGGPLQGQVILYIGSNTTKFIENFSQYGICIPKYEINPDLISVKKYTVKDLQQEMLHFFNDSQGYRKLGHRIWKVAKTHEKTSVK